MTEDTRAIVSTAAETRQSAQNENPLTITVTVTVTEELFGVVPVPVNVASTQLVVATSNTRSSQIPTVFARRSTGKVRPLTSLTVEVCALVHVLPTFNARAPRHG